MQYIIFLIFDENIYKKLINYKCNNILINYTNLQIKAIVLGNQFVGKTTMIKRLTQDNFREFYMVNRE